MGEKQKHSKSHYIQKNKKPRQHGNETKMSLSDLKTSTQGIIATANFLGAGCRREVFHLLNDYTARKNPKSEEVEEEENVEEENVEEEIAKEIEELKEEKRRFQIVDAGLNNFMFIAVNDDTLEVCELMHRIFTDLRDEKQRKTRFTSRLLPISHTCYASVADICRTARVMIQDTFFNETPKTFGILFKGRNNKSISRDEVIKEVASIATDNEKYAEFNTVNLDNAEYTIVIEIVKSIAMMSVLRDFKLLSKYNIDELTKGYSNPYKRRRDEDEEIVKDADVVKEENIVKEEVDLKTEVPVKEEVVAKKEGEENKTSDSCQDDQKKGETIKDVDPDGKPGAFEA